VGIQYEFWKTIHPQYLYNIILLWCSSIRNTDPTGSGTVRNVTIILWWTIYIYIYYLVSMSWNDWRHSALTSSDYLYNIRRYEYDDDVRLCSPRVSIFINLWHVIKLTPPNPMAGRTYIYKYHILIYRII